MTVHMQCGRALGQADVGRQAWHGVHLVCVCVCVCGATAADGQHIYMHALNIRCLVKQYGSLRDCPDTVTATVLELESVSMDEVHTHWLLCGCNA